MALIPIILALIVAFLLPIAIFAATRRKTQTRNAQEPYDSGFMASSFGGSDAGGSGGDATGCGSDGSGGGDSGGCSSH
jgi:hypothetical protein